MNGNLSIIDFNKIREHKQYDRVFTKGIFVNFYLKILSLYAFYLLFKFFVEKEFNLIQNKILNLIPIEEGKLLGRYWI
tara:strand:+ start:4914 stop:5147 length:234 start_codon:yes stop_codon:yes gene_type:complete